MQYEPPESLTPAEAGTLMDYSADMRDITATVVDLAVRGHLQDRGTGGERAARAHNQDGVRVPPDRPSCGRAPSWSRTSDRVLSGIFYDGSAEVELSDLENQFYRTLPGVKQDIFKRLVGRGLYRSRPDKVRSNWFVGAVLLVVAIVGGSIVAQCQSSVSVRSPVFVAALASGLIVVWFGRIMPARTVAGARTLEHLLGFEEFLSRVEKDRYERVVKTPEMFESYLPFAMAFGVERKWAKAFQSIYREPPKWYVASNSSGFDLGRLSNSLSDMSRRAQSAMTSSPRSTSSGSGFSRRVVRGRTRGWWGRGLVRR